MFFRSGFNHHITKSKLLGSISIFFIWNWAYNYDVITMSHTKQNVIGTFSFAWDQKHSCLYIA